MKRGDWGKREKERECVCLEPPPAVSKGVTCWPSTLRQPVPAVFFF